MLEAKMFMFGVTGFALFCLFGTPMAQAQLLDGTVHEAKVSASAIAFVPALGLVKEGGKDAAPVVLRSGGPNPNTGGFSYDINVLEGPGPGPCVEDTMGTLSTYTGENEGIVELMIPAFLGPGQTLVGRFFARVKTTPGKTGLKTVAGWTEIEDGVPPEPDGISKKARLQLKEKAPEKLVPCTVP